MSLDELERRYKAATPGEWEVRGHSRIDGVTQNGIKRTEDAAAIAALHNAFPALLALARDGERYRWLRDNPEHESYPYFDDGKWHVPYLVSNAGGFGGGVATNNFKSLDAAIDAARKGEKP